MSAVLGHPVCGTRYSSPREVQQLVSASGSLLGTGVLKHQGWGGRGIWEVWGLRCLGPNG